MKDNTDTDTFADFLLWREKNAVWFQIFGAWYSGTPINLSTYLHSNVWFSPAASVNNALQTSLTPTLNLNHVVLFSVLLLDFCLVTNIILLHQLCGLNFHCSELWKTLQRCGSFWCNSHQATCPLLLGKSFIPPSAHILAASSFAYFVELKMHTATSEQMIQLCLLP